MALADEIEADLAKRITGSGTVPCRLRLEPLALHYGTSTRPIREALARLRQRGLMDPDRIARLRIEAAKRPARGHESPRERLVRKMTRDLVARSIRGDETFLRETQVARQFGVSTTIVREQFSKLVGTGLLDHVPRRGWRLRPLRQKDLDDFVQVRQSLEVLALHLAWDKLDLQRIGAFLAGNTVADGPRRSRATIDNGFHRFIIDTAANHYITDFFDRHGGYFQLLFEWEDQDAPTAAQTVGQHRRILQSILDRDLPTAEAALRLHILDNHPVLTRVLSQPSRRQLRQR